MQSLSETPEHYAGWDSLGAPYTAAEAVSRCLVSSVSFRTFAREASQRWSEIYPESPAPIGLAEGMEAEMLEAFYRGYFSR